MFWMKMSSAKYFSDLLKAIKVVTDEGTFRVSAEGMRLVAMDPAHVSLIDFELEGAFIAGYICDKETCFTVNISELLKLLKNAKKDEWVILSYNGPKNLELTVESIFDSKTYSLEVDERHVPVFKPNLTFEARAVMRPRAALKLSLIHI